MNILVIGNGFDLAHGLPTSYKDFLQFCEKAKVIYDYKNNLSKEEYADKYLNNWKGNHYVKQWLTEAFETRKIDRISLLTGYFNGKVTTSNANLDELSHYIKHNTWLEYFWSCPSYIGENWIDFESEISKVIKALDYINKKNAEGIIIREISETKEYVIATNICKAAKKTVLENLLGEKEINEFIVFLEGELEKLIKCLEIYLAGFVEKIDAKEKFKHLKDLNLDHVLSFNYSHTFERLYGQMCRIEYDFIHGEAKSSNDLELNNMVLGIDEYLPDDRKDKEVEFISFKKFYQRIYKGTGCKYKNWLNEINQENKKYNNEIEKISRELETTLNMIDILIKEDHIKEIKRDVPKHNLYILGHSLDVTDKDILRDLILTENVHTTIYYYERRTENGKGDRGRKDLGQKIANLVKVIGQDEVIGKTGGNTKTIEFQLL